MVITCFLIIRSRLAAGLSFLLFAFCFLLLASSSVHASLSTGLVGWWKLDETALNTCSSGAYDFCDASGSGFHGTETGTPTISADTVSPQFTHARSLSFDGLADYVEIGNQAPLQITQAVTGAAWVKAAAQSDASFFGKYDSGASQRSWVMRTGATITSRLRLILSANGIAATKVYESSVVAFDNTWHHVAFTFESNTLKLYIDGVEDAAPTKSTDGAVATLHNSTATMLIGANWDSGAPARFYSGLVDEARVYNRVLTAAEVKSLFQGPGRIAGGARISNGRLSH